MKLGDMGQMDKIANTGIVDVMNIVGVAFVMSTELKLQGMEEEGEEMSAMVQQTLEDWDVVGEDKELEIAKDNIHLLYDMIKTIMKQYKDKYQGGLSSAYN